MRSISTDNDGRSYFHTGHGAEHTDDIGWQLVMRLCLLPSDAGVVPYIISYKILGEK